MLSHAAKLENTAADLPTLAILDEIRDEWEFVIDPDV
jgi:hypothetical protein